MAKSYLIDTSAVIKYLNGSLLESNSDFIDRIIDEEVHLSFISEIELQVWSPPNEMDLVIYRDFVSRADILRACLNLYKKECQCFFYPIKIGVCINLNKPKSKCLTFFR